MAHFIDHTEAREYEHRRDALVQSDVTLTSIDIQRPARAAAVPRVRSGPVADSTDTLQYPTAAHEAYILTGAVALAK